jgi:hypothetical protein
MKTVEDFMEKLGGYNQCIFITKFDHHHHMWSGRVILIPFRSGLQDGFLVPRFQFPDGGYFGSRVPDQTITNVLHKLPRHFSDLECGWWFISSHPELEGRTPLEILDDEDMIKTVAGNTEPDSLRRWW